MQVLVTINNAGMKINVGVNVKNWLIKVYVTKGFIWNPRNCECECDKSCDIDEYLEYLNCKCRKKLVEKCNESIEETRLVEKALAKNENKHKCSSCTMYIVLFSVMFTINIGITTYFVYYKYINRNKENVSKYDYTYQRTI